MMKTLRWLRGSWYAALLLVVTAVLGTSCTSQSTSSPSAPAAPGQSLTHTDEGKGGVTVQATWVVQAHLGEMNVDLPKEYPIESNTFIHVKLDTHSVDLSQYDMPRVATLSGMDNTVSVPAAGWVGVQEDSHHREGLLAFQGSGNEQWQAKEGVATLKLNGIGGVAERSYVWMFVQP